MKKKTLKSVIGAMALGSLALTGCKGGEKAPEDGSEGSTSQPADGEGEGGGEGGCGGEDGCGGDGSCGGGQ